MVRLLLGCFLVKLIFKNVFANSAKSQIRTLILFFRNFNWFVDVLEYTVIHSIATTVRLYSNISNIDFPQTANIS